MDIPQPGQNCCILFFQPVTLYTTMSLEKKRPILFPAHIPFAGCVFQEAYFDPYTAQNKFAIQVPLCGKVWTTHVNQKDIQFLY